MKDLGVVWLLHCAFVVQVFVCSQSTVQHAKDEKKGGGATTREHTANCNEHCTSPDDQHCCGTQTTVLYRPDVVFHPRPEMYHRPDIIVHRPDVVIHRPSVVIHQPPVLVHRPAVVVHQPPIIFHQPPPEIHRPQLVSHDQYVSVPHHVGSNLEHTGNIISHGGYYDGHSGGDMDSGMGGINGGTSNSNGNGCSDSSQHSCDGSVASVSDKTKVEGHQKKSKKSLTILPDEERKQIDGAHISKYGMANHSLSLAEYTTLHPSEQSNSLSSHTSATKMTNKAMKVSSDKVHNGGRKGPMSGATNQQGGNSLPVPILIPFPIIPAQGQGNAIPQNKKQRKKKKAQKTLKGGRRADAIEIGNRHRNKVVNKHLLQLTIRQENASADVQGGNVSIGRLRRDTLEMGTDTLTDEERSLREKWLHPDEKDLIPGTESNNIHHNVLAFMREVIPLLRKSKRQLFEQDDDNFDTLRWRQTRGVDDIAMVEEAERTLHDAEKAAQALTNIEVEVGVDPEHLIENTHRYVIELTGEKQRYDSAIRSHIIDVGAATKRSGVHTDINAGKRQLEYDRSKLQEINMELKELKDIELMATGLEVAKYVARERALEKLAAARSGITNVNVPQMPVSVSPPVPPVTQSVQTVGIQQIFSGYPSPPSPQASPNLYPQYATVAQAPNPQVTGVHQETVASKSDTHTPPHQVVLPPTNLISYAKPPKAHVGAADHEITKTEQSHKTADDSGSNSDSGDSHDDGGMLTFPGTTYSPPPSWLEGQKDPYTRKHNQAATKVAVVNNNPPKPVPYARPATYRPLTPETPPAVQASPYTSHIVPPAQPHGQPYSLSEAIASTLRQPIAPTLLTPEPYFNSGATTVPLQMSFTNQRAANADEVLRVSPQDEPITVHNNQVSLASARPPPPPPATALGTLPIWMGAVDGAKYGHDVSDRLRQQYAPANYHANYHKAPKLDQVAKGRAKLKYAEKKLQNVEIASKAVTGIEKAVGMDGDSIVKMIDFVKRSAIDDLKQSVDSVNKDKKVLKDIDYEKKHKVVTSDGNVAFEQAQLKLHEGEQVLADAKDRLDKIKKMEMLVTGIEVAKYYASEKAALEVQGNKRNLQAAIKREKIVKRNKVSQIVKRNKVSQIVKRNKVPQSLINKFSIINKKH